MVNEMKQMLDDTLKNLIQHDANVNDNFYKPLDGFPLTTLKDFDEMESDAKASQRKKLVSTF